MKAAQVQDKAQEQDKTPQDKDWTTQDLTTQDQTKEGRVAKCLFSINFEGIIWIPASWAIR